MLGRVQDMSWVVTDLAGPDQLDPVDALVDAAVPVHERDQVGPYAWLVVRMQTREQVLIQQLFKLSRRQAIELTQALRHGYSCNLLIFLIDKVLLALRSARF